MEETAEPMPELPLPFIGHKLDSRFSFGLRTALLVPTGNAGVAVAPSLEIYTLWPLDFVTGILDRNFGAGLEIGWYQLGGGGVTTAPGFGAYDFSWEIQTLPVNIGFMYVLESERLGLATPFNVVAVAGYNATLAWSFGHVIDGNVEQFDVAQGFYWGVGGELALWKGGLFGEYRYVNARLDFEYPAFNPILGDIAGSTFYAGYRVRL